MEVRCTIAAMAKWLTDLNFDQWLTLVFDHPVPVDQAKAWYWEFDRDEWEEDSADTVHFMTRAFENAAQVFQPYTDAQLNQGLWFLASNACSSHMFSLMNETVPWKARQRCVASIHQLYEQCFLPRCSPHLSHLPERVENPLNMVCYMWWDLIPISGRPDDTGRRDLDQAILQVLESTLYLDSIACREGALHGLGHWQMDYPRQVGEIIDRFSMTQPELPAEIQQYMLRAYGGSVQ